jgi:hypothetical protein
VIICNRCRAAGRDKPIEIDSQRIDMKIITRAPNTVEKWVERLFTIMFFCVLYSVPFLPDKDFSVSFILEYYLILIVPSVYFFVIVFSQKTLYFDEDNLAIISNAGEKLVPLRKITVIRVWLLLPCWIKYQGIRNKEETVIFRVNLFDFISADGNHITELRQRVRNLKMG